MESWNAKCCALVVLVACSSQLPPDHPCNLEQNAEARAYLTACKLRIELECAPDGPCEIEQECEREWARRCEQEEP